MDGFIKYFIHKPVVAWVANLILLLAGLVCISQLPIKQYPNVAANAITIKTAYSGADAQTVSNFITTPIENALTQVSGVDYITSTSSLGQSSIIINLTIGTPITESLAQVQAAVTQVQSDLPSDAKSPQITPNSGINPPIIFVAFQSDSMNPEQITDFLQRVVVNQLQAINGVQKARIMGERDYAMRINLSPPRMRSYNVSPSDVITAINNQNVISAVGTLYGKDVQYDLTANTDVQTEKAFNDLIVANNKGSLVRLKDIGKAELGALDLNTASIINGKVSLNVGVITYPDANELAVAKAVRNIIPRIQQELPPGLTAKVIIDKGIFIKKSLEEVLVTLVLAIFFVGLVMLLALGSWRAALIPVVTIPFAMIGTGILMAALGYSINTITLLAWVLAIGLVVDDSIVVVENIQRHLSHGEIRASAAYLGMREICFAIIAMSFTLVAVYAPIGVVSGIVGELFRQFAFTLAFSVILSGFIAITLSPMLSSRVLTQRESAFKHRIDGYTATLTQKYKDVLVWLLDRQKVIFAMTVLLVGGGLLSFILLPSALAPKEDEGLVNAYMEGPADANINYMVKNLSQMSKIIKTIPEVSNNVLIAGIPYGVNSGIARIRLVDWSKRKRDSAQVATELRDKFSKVTGLSLFTYEPPPLPGAGNLPLSIVIETAKSNDYKGLYAAAEKLKQVAMDNPGISNARIDMKIDKPTYNLTIDRNDAYESGVSMRQLADALNMLFAQPQQYQFSMEGRSYYAVPELMRNYRYASNKNVIKMIYVRGTNDTLIPLSNFVTTTQQVVPESINHFQGLLSATLSATLKPGYTIGQAVNYFDDYIQQQWGGQYIVDYAGQSRQFMQANANFEITFIFALILIYLILCAQFESFVDPLIIMLTVPLSISGGLIFLRITGSSLNIYSQIGLVTLIGLITKHGILIVDFAKKRFKQGVFSPREAILEAAGLRLRPILMTTVAMVMGAIPLIINHGPGAHAREQLGWVIAGGMLLGTFFSLFVIPWVYQWRLQAMRRA